MDGLLERLHNLFEGMWESYLYFRRGLQLLLAPDHRVDVLGLIHCSQVIFLMAKSPSGPQVYLYGTFSPCHTLQQLNSKSDSCIML